MADEERIALPLSPLTMAILLALAERELHGYALMREVEAQTDGALVPGTGSLYAALYRLADGGLIEAAEPGVDESAAPGRPRKRYRLTRAGRSLAAAEAARMARVLEVARVRLRAERGPDLNPAGGDA